MARTQAPADAGVQDPVEPVQDPTPDPAPAPAPAPVEPDPADAHPSSSSRREQADAARTHSNGQKPLALASGCAWHDVTDAAGQVIGRSGITVESSANGPVREYLTWQPRVGRVQRVPTYAAYPVVDSGELE